MISPEQRASDAFVARRSWLVPFCLCVVVGFHAYRVFACGQTAWKGGGFGMFSTVDAEHARFVKVYLLTPQGEFPVAMPRDLQKRASQLRAAPHAAATEELAERLLAKKWTDSQAVWSQRAEWVTQQQEQHRTLSHFPAGADTTNIWSYRPLGALSPLEVNHDSTFAEIAVQGVRVEVWRYRFQANENMLHAEPLFTATCKK